MHRQLGTGKLFLFSLGDFARAVLGGLLVTYILKFFNVTESSGLPLLLPPALAGPAAVGGVIRGFLIGLLIAFPIACTNILPAAAFADIAQYDAIVTGENKAGMFIAVRQFLLQFTQAAVTAIVSYVMYTGSINEYPTVYGVRLTALIACVTVFAALLLFSRYDDRGTVSAIDNWNKKEKV